jgi:hypothetical protein
MYGWVNGCLRGMLLSRYGEDIWNQIAIKAGVDTCPDWGDTAYSTDQVFFSITKAAVEVVGISESKVLEMYGIFFLEYVRDKGYEKLLLCLGNDIVDWVSSVNQLHAHLQAGGMSQMIPPDIW